MGNFAVWPRLADLGLIVDGSRPLGYATSNRRSKQERKSIRPPF